MNTKRPTHHAVYDGSKQAYLIVCNAPWSIVETVTDRIAAERRAAELSASVRA